ncbi:wsv523 [White spot syndrome virus]|uniref:Wsv523 n=4 Tax=White spot syndrome virus TaxID=342409 RepID=Q8VAA3_WSSVS|nr:wsv523 [Shrimp white spot syndrome virus]AFX59884.1 wsv523 [White spot syndrome virus]AAL33524.1 wsv523 [Shrimp white spot syndrome virus]AAL88916.1 WSSV048 [Shrimp white spot syndrome virus]AWQ61056.1 wsv523 [Shrimp white spot syndrome virus]AWQ61451.1 wsv523 [Shrimp white spot syndrome virus]
MTSLASFFPHLLNELAISSVFPFAVLEPFLSPSVFSLVLVSSPTSLLVLRPGIFFSVTQSPLFSSFSPFSSSSSSASSSSSSSSSP